MRGHGANPEVLALTIGPPGFSGARCRRETAGEMEAAGNRSVGFSTSRFSAAKGLPQKGLTEF